MKASFSISVDPLRNLVRMQLGGFFTPADIAEFVATRNSAHRQLRSAPNQHVTLVDIRQMEIQSQDAVTEFQAVMSAPATASKRIAFVVSASLARMQVQRAATQRTAAFFRTVEEAEAWVFGDAEISAAA